MVLNGTYTSLLFLVLFLSNNGGGGYFKELLVDKRKQKLDKAFINKIKVLIYKTLVFLMERLSKTSTTFFQYTN